MGERSVGSHSQSEMLYPFLVILSTNHTFYTHIKERQMAEEEELGVCTAIKLQRSDLSLFSWVP